MNTHAKTYRARRLALGLKQREVAVLADISMPVISQIERGLCSPFCERRLDNALCMLEAQERAKEAARGQS